MSGRFLGKQWTSFQIITAGFLAVIQIGALLLSLPVSSSSGEWTPLPDALFTAASAVCVTGLVIRDTATVSTHVGGTDREVETVAHVRETRVVGLRPWIGVVIRLLILLALFLIIKKIGLWQLIRSMFSTGI